MVIGRQSAVIGQRSSVGGQPPAVEFQGGRNVTHQSSWGRLRELSQGRGVGKAVAQLSIEAKVELVTDAQEMLRYGVMSTPAIVINDKVVSTGRVPALSQIVTMITNAL